MDWLRDIQYEGLQGSGQGCWILRPPSTSIRIIFDNGDFPLRFRKNPHVVAVYSNLWKHDNIPHRVCVMLVVYDERHRRIRKPPFSAFSRISTPKSVFEKLRFPWPFSPDTCGRYFKPLKKKSPFSDKKGHVWTGPSCLSVKIWVIS